MRLTSYVEDSLGTGEVVKYSARLSLWRYWLYFVLGALFVIGSIPLFSGSFRSSPDSSHSTAAGVAGGAVLFLGVLLIVWPLIARKSAELVITSKRVIAKFGLVSTRSIEIRLAKIESVRVSQGLIGRIFNYGDIMLTGTGSTFDPIPHISHPLRFRSALNEAMEENLEPKSSV